jgi:hypothetical protein
MQIIKKWKVEHTLLNHLIKIKKKKELNKLVKEWKENKGVDWWNQVDSLKEVDRSLILKKHYAYILINFWKI